MPAVDEHHAPDHGRKTEREGDHAGQKEIVQDGQRRTLAPQAEFRPDRGNTEAAGRLVALQHFEKAVRAAGNGQRHGDDADDPLEGVGAIVRCHVILPPEDGKHHKGLARPGIDRGQKRIRPARLTWFLCWVRVGVRFAPQPGTVMNKPVQRIARSACPHDCPSTCALDVEILDNYTIGRVRGAKDDPYTDGVICEKVARYAERVHHPRPAPAPDAAHRRQR